MAGRGFPPVMGEVAMREFMAATKGRDWHPMIYGDGLCWVTSQTNTGDDGMPYFRARGGEQAVGYAKLGRKACGRYLGLAKKLCNLHRNGEGPTGASGDDTRHGGVPAGYYSAVRSRARTSGLLRNRPRPSSRSRSLNDSGVLSPAQSGPSRSNLN